MLIHKSIIIFLVLSCFFYTSKALAQNKEESKFFLKEKISLSDIIKLAGENSLDVIKVKQKYRVNHWEFKSFKSSLLPKINFQLHPFTFNRAFVKRYDSNQNIDVYREQQTLSSFANISINQNIRPTGTKLFINSSFDRLINSGGIRVENYNATPIQIGLQQPIMAFNDFKWNHKIEPIKYNKSKNDFLFELESINIKSVKLFFEWALASKKVEIAKENKLSVEKLFKIGKKRYDIGTIERNDLLNLKLDVYNAKTILTQNLQVLEKTKSNLKLFLGEKLPNNISPILPELITNLKINVDQAINLTKKNNPKIIDIKLKRIEALRDLDKTIKDNRFDLSINASYGLNQQSNTFHNAYSNFLDQQMVSIQFNIPILDWGERKGKINTARMNKNVIEVEQRLKEESLKEIIILKVMDFNLQKELVEDAFMSSEISKESYKITEKRFLRGNLDYLKLISSRQAWQYTTESYIKSLLNYWTLYFEIQQLTLFNFIKGTSLSSDFSNLENKNY